MDEFIIRALLAGFLVVLVSGPLGCVVVWRRMAYFGDALSHSALLGTVLALMMNIDPLFGVLLMGFLVSSLLVIWQRKKELSSDSLLGILAHGSLAAGIVAIAFMQNAGLRVDLMAYLFGDILAVSWTDLAWMLAVVLFVLIAMQRLWTPLLSMTVHEELARSEGVPVDRIRFIFMLLMAMVIAVAIQVVGVLLITALLIVPAASARRFVHSPEAMLGLAILFGAVSVTGGVFASMEWDSPTGPSIVLVAVLIFFVSRVVVFKRK